MPQSSQHAAGPEDLRPGLRAAILDAALEIAEEKGQWSAVRLHDVADRLHIPVAEVPDHQRDLHRVADARLLRGLKAMVGPKPADFIQQPARRRGEVCLLAWFD